MVEEEMMFRLHQPCRVLLRTAFRGLLAQSYRLKPHLGLG